MVAPRHDFRILRLCLFHTKPKYGINSPRYPCISNFDTRNCKDIQIPRYNLKYVTKGFHYHYSALIARNSIPIREMPTFPQSKSNLKTHLKSCINMKCDSLEEQQIGCNSFQTTLSCCIHCTVACDFIVDDFYAAGILRYK